MKFSIANILGALLCADAALGAVNTQKRHASREARRLARRSSGVLRSHPKIASELAPHDKFQEYSENWAGAVLVSTGYTSVTGVVTAPSVSGSSDAAGSAWVGIDGDTCDTAILQTGIDWYADGTYDAWYEWYPSYAGTFDHSTPCQYKG